MGAPGPDKPLVVMVTGASAGVGRAVVRRFSRPGVAIGLIARGAEGLAATAKEVVAAGGRASIHQVDVADPVAVQRAARDLETAHGPIDIWINNAMTSVFSPVMSMQPDEYRRVTEVTYLGVVHGTLAALSRMRGRNAGVIIQVGSALAYRGIPLQSAYCAAKHAIKGFTESLRCELIHDRSRIHVGMVHLPAVNTPQFAWVLSRLPRKAQPVPPIFQPEIAADAIHYACFHCRREILLGFPTMLAVNANKIAPGLIDRYLARTAFDSQQTQEPAEKDPPNDLWQPVAGDAGAHGSFDARACRSSVAWFVVKHRRLVALGLIGAIAALMALGMLIAHAHHASAMTEVRAGHVISGHRLR